MADTEELTSKLAAELVKEFKDQVEVKYCNTDEDGINKYPEIVQLANLVPFPITSVNNQPRLTGAVNIEEIRKIVKELLA